VVDARPVWAATVAGHRLDEAFADARDHPRLLRLLESLALAHRPPTGFFRGLVLEYDGQRRGRLDIKQGAALPITDLARWAAIAAGVTAATTLQRLDAAAAAGTLEAEDAVTLRDAFELAAGLRLEHQVDQLRNGEPADDLLEVDSLTPLTRGYLKQALRAIAHVQRGISALAELNR